LFLPSKSVGYSSATAYIVIVIVALAEELLTSVWMVVISLSGMLVSVKEVSVSDAITTGRLANISARAIKRISFFNSSLSLYAHFVRNRRLSKARRHYLAMGKVSKQAFSG